MKKQIFTLLLSSLFISAGWAQTQRATVKKADVLPVIDGIVDPIWADLEAQNLTLPYNGESPTLGAEGATNWKALWSNDGIYVLVTVDDDVWAPLYDSESPNDSYRFDKVEIYFDVNYAKQDGLGPNIGSGHYTFQPEPVKGKLGVAIESNLKSKYAYNLRGSSYVFEIFVPFSGLLDMDGTAVDKSGEIGFDVYVVDNDVLPTAVRNRMVWSNVGNLGENYSNMDEAGIITLEGAGDLISIKNITLSDTSITVDNDTVQIASVIAPADASSKALTWKLTNGTGTARIDSEGRIVPVKNGTVTVQAFAADGGFVESNIITVTISGQVIQAEELNYIKAGDFDVDGARPEPWFGSDLTTIVNGVAECNPAATGSPWDYKLAQTISVPVEFKDLKYILSFKAWADEPRIMSLNFEDATGPLYNRYGSSTDTEANVTNDYTTPGESAWSLELTNVPTEYNLHVTFNEMTDKTVQNFNFFLAEALGKVYIDHVSLFSEDDLALINATSSHSINANTTKVYPNPVGAGNHLNVEVATANTKVAIYNTNGQKLMEKAATGNVVQFNVSNLSKGIYIVRLSDGTNQKFIK